MNRTGLAEMFPKASEHLGVDPVMTSGSFMEGKGDISAILFKNFTYMKKSVINVSPPFYEQLTFVKCLVSTSWCQLLSSSRTIFASPTTSSLPTK